MTSGKLTYKIIPALPGFYTVMDYGNKGSPDVMLGEPIIAWRIETHYGKNSEDVFSVCIALTVNGDITEQCIGVQNPDKTVTAFHHFTYESLEALKADR